MKVNFDRMRATASRSGWRRFLPTYYFLLTTCVTFFIICNDNTVSSAAVGESGALVGWPSRTRHTDTTMSGLTSHHHHSSNTNHYTSNNTNTDRNTNNNNNNNNNDSTSTNMISNNPNILLPPSSISNQNVNLYNSNSNPNKNNNHDDNNNSSLKRAPVKPYFEDVSPRNVTAVVGQTALLKCTVKHAGDRTISWMRKRDLHILTSNVHTYTGDGRFSVIHPDGSDQWNLKIEFVQKRDAGVYECQVNTEPKINLALLLTIDDAQARIHGPDEVYVKKGSTISLSCSVNMHFSPASSIVWLQGNTVVDFESARGGISMETEKTETATTSKLLVTKASLTDSGNYTCQPSNAKPASVFVHVLNGEHPAAMQHGEHGGGAGSKLAFRSWTTMIALFVISFS